ncbi:hypothetical protein GUITHDRAFT_139944 [Guillardia theta CCMP2712]|uniref:Uncharacterized protein n=1 Tax=Guillardia theta (strain CCMP2712) TaxID=905079 RepID=L1J6C1_GUITC|nr:hypothetical protein GUITHDRAFT_139944 [Guillardia theta CCMP2712]EKX44088.1 hypothetical protein GUITHDRAFT_139944 [Guillardia theta CCMP2712]|eukprot:XP_005831068.1 hypothetical protein GUITHDRAFT_139944 [Guillardia theta CCMP2712]
MVKDGVCSALPSENMSKASFKEVIQESTVKKQCPFSAEGFDLLEWMHQMEDALTEVHSSDDEVEEEEVLSQAKESFPEPVEQDDFRKTASAPQSRGYELLEVDDFPLFKTLSAPMSVTKLQSTIAGGEFEFATFSRPDRTRAEYNRAVGHFAKQ